MRSGILAAFGLALVCAASALAQPPKGADAKSIQANLEWTAADRDFIGEGQLVADEILHEGRSATQDFDVQAGETYLVAGVCDTHCSSMGLRVTDAMGKILIESHSSSDTPALTFTSAKAGTITVATAMAECSAKAGCRYGLAVVASGAPSAKASGVLSADPAKLEAVRAATIDRGESNNYKREGKLQTGVLRQGESIKVSFDLDPAKTHAVIAKCDDHCGNLDLHGYDPKGAEFVKDTDSDPSPVLLIDKGQSGDKAIVKLDMVTCEAKACVYAVGLFTRD